jgi:hypothetical protein
LSNKCECDDDYTFDDNNQCVEKQHNVYFKLLDINPEDDKTLLIKSEYDSRKYIVRIGLGCLGTSVERYLGQNLVVNLGTDYEVDTWDTIVLQDHSQTCSIMYKERTYDDSFPEPEEESSDSWYVPPIVNSSPVTEADMAVEDPLSPDTTEQKPVLKTELVELDAEVSSSTAVNEESSTSTLEIPAQEQTNIAGTDTPIQKPSILSRILGFFRGLF